MDSPNPRGYRISVLANPVRPTIGRMHADGAQKKFPNPPQKKNQKCPKHPKNAQKKQKNPKISPLRKKKVFGFGFGLVLDSDSDLVNTLSGQD